MKFDYAYRPFLPGVAEVIVRMLKPEKLAEFTHEMRRDEEDLLIRSRMIGRFIDTIETFQRVEES